MEPDEIAITEREEIQAMLGNNPGCWVRFGIPLLLALFMVLIALGWYVQYPDVVSVPLTLSSERPPVRVPARAAAAISRLAVRDGEPVHAGQLLAELESGALGSDVAALGQLLDKLDRANTPEGFAALPVPTQLQLGPLQTSFAAFIQARQTLKGLLQQDYVSRQIQSLENEIRETQRLIESLDRQAAILQEDFSLAEKQLGRQRELLKEGLISAQDFDASNAAYLRQKQQLEGFIAAASTHRIKIRQLEAEQSRLSQGRRQDLITQWESLRQTGRQLRGEMTQWELRYQIKAPVAGQLVFAQPLTAGQYLHTDQELFAVLPDSAGAELLAVGMLPQANSGKVAPGQTVRIRLDAYPYPEFGLLEGRVATIAALPAGDHYLIRITLPRDLRTTTGKTLPFQPEARGIGNILTQKRSLLQRVFDRILSLRS